MRKFAIAFMSMAILSILGPAAGCGSSSSGMPSTDVPATDSYGAPYYANSSNWLALPQASTKKVDIFYLSDTTYQKASPSSPNIGPIDDPQMKTGAEAQFSRTATAFETVGDIYAPYNRQVDSQYKSTLPIPEQLSLEALQP